MARLVPKHGFERCHSYSRMVGVVVPELSQRNLETPLSWACLSETSQKGFHTLVNSFRLTVRLGVVGCAESELSTCGLEKLLPEVAGEDRITIRDDCTWQPMQLVNLVHIEEGYFGCSLRICQWKEVCELGALVHNHQKTVELS